MKNIFVFVLILLSACAKKGEINTDAEIISEQHYEIENANEQFDEVVLPDNDINENSEAYEIISVYSHIYNQEMKKIESEKIGDIIVIENDKLIFGNEEYQICDGTDTESYEEWNIRFIGMNYVPFDKNILEGYNGKIFTKKTMKNERYYYIYLIGNTIIMHIKASQIEEEKLRKLIVNETYDDFFYIAQKK